MTTCSGKASLAYAICAVSKQQISVSRAHSLFPSESEWFTGYNAKLTILHQVVDQARLGQQFERSLEQQQK